MDKDALAGLLVVVSIVFLLCVPGSVGRAHAHFGTSNHASHASHSSPSHSSYSGRATVHSDGSVTGGRSRAREVRSSSDSSDGWASHAPTRTHSMWDAPRVSADWGPPRYHVWGYGFAVEPTVVVGPSLDAAPIDADNELPYGDEIVERPAPIASALAGDLTLADQAAMLGLQASFEGSLFGFVAGYTGVLTAPPDDGAPSSVDVLHLAQARLTYALISGERGRLRAELGAHLAVAPDATFLAPGFGLFGVLGLSGPFGLEGRIYGNVWPYSQLDVRAGVTVASARIGVSIGYRMLYLNDNGALGPANAGATSDFYRGPYVSLAIGL